ncbi:MAG: hypothetical protein ACR2PL_25645 [Dehalococcoidia bacterium]
MGQEVYLSSAGGDPVVGSWTVYRIPLSAFGAVGKVVGGIAIQDESGQAQPTLYLDQIGFAH